MKNTIQELSSDIIIYLSSLVDNRGDSETCRVITKVHLSRKPEDRDEISIEFLRDGEIYDIVEVSDQEYASGKEISKADLLEYLKREIPWK